MRLLLFVCLFLHAPLRTSAQTGRALALLVSACPLPALPSLHRTAPPPRPRRSDILCGGCLRRANTDPVLYYQTQDKWIREYWVHVEYMKLLKDEVRNCYRREGVNHYENCRDLVHEYYARTKAPMFSLKGPK